MKLLDKRAIDKAKSEDRAREVAEGQKLAKRVDVLRETQAEEEKNLAAFRNKTLSEIQRQIEAKEAEIVTLDEHIFKLKAEREVLFVPLDAEWEKVNRQKRQLEKDKEQLSVLALSLSLREESAIKAENEARVELGRAENLKHLAALDRSHASQIIEDARRDATQWREQAEMLVAQAELREKGSLRREAEVAARERNVTNRWEKVEKYEEDLFKRELQLREGWKNLQASHQFIKNG